MKSFNSFRLMDFEDTFLERSHPTFHNSFEPCWSWVTTALDGFLVMVFLEMVEGVYHVLQAVHVVSVDVPVAEVAVAGVLRVSDLLGHDRPVDVIPDVDVTLQHGHLQLAEDLRQEEHEVWLTSGADAWKLKRRKFCGDSSSLG